MFAIRGHNQWRTKMKVAVLGYGTVGKGVYDMLRASSMFEAGPVLVRPGKTDEPFKVDSIDAIVNDESVDAVAEVMGGVDVPYAYAKRVLSAGKHFVTSNKALVAARGIELGALARENNAAFLFSAACGGGVFSQRSSTAWISSESGRMKKRLSTAPSLQER